MSKRTFITIILSGGLFTLIVTDFYHGIPWYIQFGPIILAFLIIFIGAYFENKNGEVEESDSGDEEQGSKKQWLYAMCLVWAAIIAMNIFVGEPEGNVFNIRNPEFWILVVALPLLSQFNFKKSTDGV